MIPVFDPHVVPLMPCTPRRAKLLMVRKQAKPYWHKGIFCIVLQRPPSAYNMQDVVVAIDPGSKRTGVTVTTPTKVVFNILANAPTLVKKKMEQRKALRRSRRNRNTPYRKCRSNRRIGGIPPSTKARWQAHLRLINLARQVCKVTHVAFEDIKARTIKGARRWNANFSPLQVGKKWFAEQVKLMGLGLTLFAGYETAAHRCLRGFLKNPKKLSDTWDAHNVDSHCLAELHFGPIHPIKRFYKLEFLQPKRRQLHIANFVRGKRRRHGGTLTAGLQRGTLVRHVKHGLKQIGGFCGAGISLACLKTGKLTSRYAKLQDLQIVSKLGWRIAFR